MTHMHNIFDASYICGRIYLYFLKGEETSQEKSMQFRDDVSDVNDRFI